MGEPVGVNGADAGRRPGDQSRAAIVAMFSTSLRPAGCEVACKKLVTSLSLCNGHRKIFHWRLPDSRGLAIVGDA